jgi:tetratricopeptide (TPR) repeat protein
MGWHQLEKCYFYSYRIKKLFIVLFCVTIALFCLKTQSRNNEWKNELSLFSSAIKVNPNNAKLYNNIGHYYERLKNYSKAYEYFKLASDHQSDDLGSQINIARTLINLGEEEKAEQLLWKIKPRVKHSAINKRIVPNYLNLWINLANILVKNEDRLQEAENVSQSF